MFYLLLYCHQAAHLPGRDCECSEVEKLFFFSFELKAGELGTSVHKKCAVRGTSDSGVTGENLRGRSEG